MRSSSVQRFRGVFLVLSVSGEGKGRNDFAERHNYAERNVCRMTKSDERACAEMRWKHFQSKEWL